MKGKYANVTYCSIDKCFIVRTDKGVEHRYANKEVALQAARMYTHKDIVQWVTTGQSAFFTVVLLGYLYTGAMWFVIR